MPLAFFPVSAGSAVPSTASTPEVKTTTCYMCACRCGINVTVEDGEVRFIQGNPEHPINKGVLCAKGASGIMKQYSPARLTKPLRRKAGAERGTSEFEEISWEEAFATISERLQHIRETDPRGRTIWWIGPPGLAQDAGPGTDFHATQHGHMAITPLSVDLTDHQALTYWAQSMAHMGGA